MPPLRLPLRKRRGTEPAPPPHLKAQPPTPQSTTSCTTKHHRLPATKQRGDGTVLVMCPSVYGGDRAPHRLGATQAAFRLTAWRRFLTPQRPPRYAAATRSLRRQHPVATACGFGVTPQRSERGSLRATCRASRCTATATNPKKYYKTGKRHAATIDISGKALPLQL